MSSAKPRKNSLADAFGVDADELRTPKVGETATTAVINPPPDPALARMTTQTTTNPPIPNKRSPKPAVADDIVEIDGHEYVRHPDGRLDPAENTTQLNFTVTNKERHLLRRLAFEERRSLVSYLREILESRGLL